MQGTIEGYEHEYTLDQGHTFEAGRPALVCGNTAAMLGEDSVSWLSPHFQARNPYVDDFLVNWQVGRCCEDTRARRKDFLPLL